MLRTLATVALLVIISLSASAQVPLTISYQAAVRDASGNPIASQAVTFRFEVRDDASTLLYSESQGVTTSSLGLVNLAIGTGSAEAPNGLYNSLDAIPWTSLATTSLAAPSIDVLVDPDGMGYVAFGNLAIQFVPFAASALESADNHWTLDSGKLGNVAADTVEVTAGDHIRMLAGGAGGASVEMLSAGGNTLRIDQLNSATTGNAIEVEGKISDGFGLKSEVSGISVPGITPVSAAVYGQQSGLGSAGYFKHDGNDGPTLRIDQTSALNADAVVEISYSAATAYGLAVFGNSNPGGIIAVNPTPAFGVDPRAVSGSSFNGGISGYGYGGEFIGGYVGVVGSAADPFSSLAGVFASGDLGASGIKSFIIDHPFKPASHFLRHYCIESDEVLNMYRGTVQLDASGEAVVELPDYFDAININCSYQLTSIGSPVQPWVKQEIEGNRFVVAGDPGAKVSWTVHAERNDAYMQSRPDLRNAEPEKPEARKGTYMQPELHGQPESKGIFYQEKPGQ